MTKRLELHQELLQFLPHVYFQPPSDIRMTFPCIAYTKSSIDIKYANNKIYKMAQEYQITLMEADPDSTLADRILEHFQYSAPGSNFVSDGLNHTIIKIYY